MENDVSARIDRMVEIKRQQEALKKEWAELEALFLKQGDEDLADTKRKSVSYYGNQAKLTITTAQKTEVTWPTGLKHIFMENYAKAVTEKLDYKLSSEATRILAGIGTRNFVRRSVADIISEIPVDDKTRKVLSKKLRGSNYDKDKEHLMTIGGLNEDDAGDYAYFVYEAAVWEGFQRLVVTNQIKGSEAMEEIIDYIEKAVVVTETPKVTLDLFEG